MATLERVMQMREQGLSENQIVQTLRQEGIAPKEIEESLSQSKIKYALNEEQPTMENQEQGMGYDQGFSKSSFQGDGAPVPLPEEYAEMQQGQPPTQEYYPDYQPQGNYQEYQPPQPFDIETINEMVEQAIEEKNESLKKQVSSFTRFKEDSSIEMSKISQRLQKIEDTISELQTAILRKIGEYGNDIHSIAREMQETQNTFSKIVDPLTDSIRDLREISDSISPNKIPPHHKQAQENSAPEQREHRETREKPSKSKDGFENFLR
jgi:DNA-binding transcriptional MerR regulator